MTYIALNAHGLKLFDMKRCPCCGDVKHVSEFYRSARGYAARCKQCKVAEDKSFVNGMTYHIRGALAFAEADRKCKCCGMTFAAFPELWHGDRCAFCAEDCEASDGR